MDKLNLTSHQGSTDVLIQVRVIVLGNSRKRQTGNGLRERIVSNWGGVDEKFEIEVVRDR